MSRPRRLRLVRRARSLVSTAAAAPERDVRAGACGDELVERRIDAWLRGQRRRGSRVHARTRGPRALPSRTRCARRTHVTRRLEGARVVGVAVAAGALLGLVASGLGFASMYFAPKETPAHPDAPVPIRDAHVWGFVRNDDSAFAIHLHGRAPDSVGTVRVAPNASTDRAAKLEAIAPRAERRRHVFWAQRRMGGDGGRVDRSSRRRSRAASSCGTTAWRAATRVRVRRVSIDRRGHGVASRRCSATSTPRASSPSAARSARVRSRFVSTTRRAARRGGIGPRSSRSSRRRPASCARRVTHPAARARAASSA